MLIKTELLIDGVTATIGCSLVPITTAGRRSFTQVAIIA
jgi:hypothetical protein